MTKIEIRTATLDDLSSILELYAQPSMNDGKVMTLEQATKVFQKISENPNYTIYVANSDGEIMGSFAIITVQLLSHQGDTMGILEDVVVRTDLQGRGLGRKMIEFANAKCEELGCYKIIISSGLNREKAHIFYEKLGYEKHGYSFYLRVKE